MEIFCEQTDLNRAVNIVNKAVANRTSMPILECILFTVANDEILLTATDTELGISTTLEGEIKEEGNIALDAKLLSPIVAKLPSGRVHIKTDGDNVKLTCGKAKFNLSFRDGEDFPYMDEVDRSNSITIDQGELRALIAGTIFAVADSDNNKMMTGELVEVKDRLRMVGLDGHRVSIREAEIEGDMKVIVPHKTLNEVMRMPYEGDVEIYYDKSHILFRYDGTTVTSRLIEGEYFNIQNLISDDFVTTAKASRNDLIDCTERAMLLVTQDKKPMILDVKDELAVTMTTSTSELSEVVQIERQGEDIRLGVNPKFLLDALKSIDDDEVELSMSGTKAPIVIKGDGYRHIILPVNIGG